MFAARGPAPREPSGWGEATLIVLEFIDFRFPVAGHQITTVRYLGRDDSPTRDNGNLKVALLVAVIAGIVA